VIWFGEPSLKARALQCVYLSVQYYYWHWTESLMSFICHICAIYQGTRVNET